MGFSDGAGPFGWKVPGYTYRYIWFFSGCLDGLECRMGTIDGVFGETAEIWDIFIVFEIFAGVLVIFTFWLTVQKPND